MGNVLTEQSLEDFTHTERCSRICNGKCSLDKNNIRCITDMVINKSWTTLEILKKAKSECECSHLSELLGMSIKNLKDLILWAKKIQKL